MIGEIVGGPLYLFHLNGNSNDALGGNNGTDTDITYSVADGKFGQGALFNGTTSKIVSANSAPSTNQTLSCWFKQGGSTGGEQNLITWDDASAHYQRFKYVYGASTSTIQWETNQVAYNLYTSNTFTTDTNFHLATVTQLGTGDPIFYLDSVLIANTHNNTGDATKCGSVPLTIGVSGSTGQFFKGSIDEVAIYNRVLSSRDIKDYYNWATKSRFTKVI